MAESSEVLNLSKVELPFCHRKQDTAVVVLLLGFLTFKSEVVSLKRMGARIHEAHAKKKRKGRGKEQKASNFFKGRYTTGKSRCAVLCRRGTYGVSDKCEDFPPCALLPQKTKQSKKIKAANVRRKKRFLGGHLPHMERQQSIQMSGNFCRPNDIMMLTIRPSLHKLYSSTSF